MGIALTVNGAPVEVRVDGTTSLILGMRNELGLKGNALRLRRRRLRRLQRRSAPPRQYLSSLTFPFCRRMSCPTQPVPMSR